MARATISTDLTLDTARFQRGMAIAQNKVRAFTASALSSLGLLAGAAGFGALSSAAINLGSKISDLAIQLKIGSEELQVLRFAAQEAGVGMSLLERGLKNANLRTQEAINGGKRYSDAFARLGINLEKFAQLKTEQKLETIAIAQERATNKAAAYSDVAIILGERSGPALQEVLQNLASEGFGKLSQAARDAGQVMSTETIARLDRASDTIEKTKTKVTILWGEFLTKAIPVLQIFGGGLTILLSILKTVGSGFLGFALTIGKVIKIAIQPAISAFESLSLAASASVEAVKGNFGAAKEKILQSKEAIASVIDTIKTIPEETSKAFEDLRLKSNRLQKESKKTQVDAVEDIKRSFKSLFSLIDEAEKKENRIKQRNRARSRANLNEGEGGEAGRVDLGKSSKDNPLRKPAKGIRFERVGLGGGEFANQRFFNGSKAGVFSNRQLVDAAMGPRAKNESDETASERTEYLKNINKLLDRLNGALGEN